MANDTQAKSRTATGIDVSDKVSHICVLGDEGQVLEVARIPTSREAFERRFRGVSPARIALEVGPHSPWLSRLLEDLSHEVIVANPRRVRLIYESDSKSDRIDAECLARLARLDPKLLAPVKHRSPRAQAVRALLGARHGLVAARTKLINTVRGQAKSLGATLPRCSTDSFASRVAEHIPKELWLATSPLLDVIGELTRKIAGYDKQVEKIAETEFPQTALLRCVPGVGPVTSLAYVVTIEDPLRFANGRAVGAYLGLRPRKDQSGDSDPQKRITKAGDPILRRLMVQSAHYILGPFGPESDLRRWGLQLAARGGKAAKKRAVIGVARKLAGILRALWLTGEAYEPIRAEGSSTSTNLETEPNRPVRATARVLLARRTSAEAAPQNAAPELDGPQHARAEMLGDQSANGSVAKGSLSRRASKKRAFAVPIGERSTESRSTITTGSVAEPASRRASSKRRPPSRP